MGIFAVCTSTFRVLLRGRYLYFALASLGFMVAAALMAATFSGRQPATVALDVGISVFRFGIPIFVAVLAQGLVTDEFERRYYLSSMTYPHSRTAWLMGRYVTIVLAAATVLLIHALVLHELVAYVGRGYDQATKVAIGAPYWLVIAFAYIDLLVIASFALLLAVFARSPGFVIFGTLGFLLIARSYSSIYFLLDGSSGLVRHEATYKAGLGTLRYLFPNLGELDIRAVSLYGRMDFLPIIWPQHLAGCILYAIAVVGLAVWLIRRKQFV